MYFLGPSRSAYHNTAAHTEQNPPKSDVIDLNSMYALVMGLLLVLGLSGDASGMCGESRQQIESHIGSSEGLSHRREHSAVSL